MNSLSPINADFSGFLFLLELPLIRLFFFYRYVYFLFTCLCQVILHNIICSTGSDIPSFFLLIRNLYF